MPDTRVPLKKCQASSRQGPCQDSASHVATYEKRDGDCPEECFPTRKFFCHTHAEGLEAAHAPHPALGDGTGWSYCPAHHRLRLVSMEWE